MLSAKLKRFLSVLMVVVIMASMSTVALATDAKTDVSQICMRALYADSQLRAYLLEQGITLQDNDAIVVQYSNGPSRSAPEARELQVIHEENGELDVVSIVSFAETEDGSVERAKPPVSVRPGARTSQTIVWDVKNYPQIVLNVSFTVSYERTTILGYGYTYQPKYLSFSYTKLLSCGVNKLEAEYDCAGTLIDMNSGATSSDYTHVLFKSVSGPAPGTTYTDYNPLSSPYYIATQYGTPGECLIHCIFTHNGETLDLYHAPNLTVVS